MILTTEVITQELSTLNKWKYQNNTIHKTFKFKNFVDAFGFMSRVALCAERADHHPDWSNSYHTVEINLTTHSEGGVTQKDIKLAQEIDALA